MAYALDLNATLSANYVTQTVTRPATGVWIFVLEGGAFYTKDLVIRDTFSNRELTPLTQYRALETVPAAVIASGKEVLSALVITDPAVNEVVVSYRVVGGEYSVTGSTITNTLASMPVNDLNSTAWGQVLNKPNQYPPELHTHYDKEAYGFESATYMLGQIREAITTGDGNVLGMIYQLIDRRFAALTQSTNTQVNNLQTEVNKAKTEARFKPNDIYLSADGTHPNTKWGYGQWERLADGAIMMTSDNSKIGTTRQLGEGVSYDATFYAAWRFISE